MRIDVNIRRFFASPPNETQNESCDYSNNHFDKIHADLISIKAQLVEGLIITNSANVLRFENYRLKPEVFFEGVFTCELLLGQTGNIRTTTLTNWT